MQRYAPFPRMTKPIDLYAQSQELFQDDFLNWIRKILSENVSRTWYKSCFLTQVVSNMSSAVIESIFSATSPEIIAAVEPLPSIRSIWNIHRGTKVVRCLHLVQSKSLLSFVRNFYLQPEHSSTQNLEVCD